MKTITFPANFRQNNTSHLVISSVVGYKAEVIESYLRSLYAFCPTADVVLVAGQVNQDFEKTVKTFNPNVILATVIPNHVIDFISLIPGVRKLVRSIPRMITKISWKYGNIFIKKLSSVISAIGEGRFITPLLAIAQGRYFIAKEILEEYFQDVELVLLSDSRDVFFQGNPFENLEGNLASGLEDEKIRQSSYNSNWINHFYGKVGLDQIEDRLIICSGVTIGKRNAMLDYLDGMCDEISKFLLKCAFMPGLDQGLHNWIIRENGIKITLLPNGNNLIGTSGFSNPELFTFEERKGLFTLENEPVKIVHQYDRFNNLQIWCQNKWGNG